MARSTSSSSTSPGSWPRLFWAHRIAAVCLAAIGIAVGAGAFYASARLLRGDRVEADLNAALLCEQEAAAFSDYPLVFAGNEVLGYSLRGCRRNKTPDRYAPDGTLFHQATDSFTFVYGECTIPEGAPSCPVPVAIIVYPPCEEPIYPGAVSKTVAVRGIDAYVKNDGSIRMEEPTYKLTIYAPGLTFDERSKNAITVAESLLAANDLAAPLTAGAPLSKELGVARSCR